MSVDSKSSYYDAGGIESIEIIKAKLTPDQYEGYLHGNILKYSTRANFKGTYRRDMEKVAVYTELLNDWVLLVGKAPHDHQTARDVFQSETRAADEPIPGAVEMCYNEGCPNYNTKHRNNCNTVLDGLATSCLSYVPLTSNANNVRCRNTECVHYSVDYASRCSRHDNPSETTCARYQDTMTINIEGFCGQRNCKWYDEESGSNCLNMEDIANCGLRK